VSGVVGGEPRVGGEGVGGGSANKQLLPTFPSPSPPFSDCLQLQFSDPHSCPTPSRSANPAACGAAAWLRRRQTVTWSRVSAGCGRDRGAGTPRRSATRRRRRASGSAHSTPPRTPPAHTTPQRGCCADPRPGPTSRTPPPTTTSSTCPPPQHHTRLPLPQASRRRRSRGRLAAALAPPWNPSAARARGPCSRRGPRRHRSPTSTAAATAVPRPRSWTMTARMRPPLRHARPRSRSTLTCPPAAAAEPASGLTLMRRVSSGSRHCGCDVELNRAVA
jgi:hypothetical protein